MTNRDVHDLYPMRTVARLTGLTPDLIRAWEKRYRVVSPVRGPRGARLYTAEDVEHLRLLATLVARGRAIGDIAKLDRARLHALSGPAREPGGAGRGPAADTAGSVVRRVLRAAAAYDAAEVERQLGDALLALGGRAFVQRLAGPLLDEVGKRWEAGKLSVASEHLISAALRNLLGGLLRAPENAAAPGILLAAPSGERHEFGLLFVAFLAAHSGLRLCLLGTDTPAAEITASALSARVDAVGLTLVSSENRARAAEQVEAIDSALPANVELWLGGRDARATHRSMGQTRSLVLQHAGEIETQIGRLLERSRTPH